ncbi:MAG: hypothetical protein ACLGJB_17790 [Blastocatellia bacterium]
MIIELALPRNKKGQITAQASDYRPSQEVKDRTIMVMNDFKLSREIMTKSYRQFNDLSVADRQSADQASFNGYVAPPSDDPDEAWKSNAVRPIVRNRTISIAAHVTGALIFPHIFAQNDQDAEDKDAATVMRDLMEWASEQSNYVKTFLYSVIAALVNPAVIIHTEYAQRYRTIKEITAEGKWTPKRVLDEIFSGFQDSIVPIDELYIADIYEPDIQKQGHLIWRRAPDFTVLESKYGDNPIFKKYCRPGLQILFDEATSQFYAQYDENLRGRLGEEIIYYNRNLDLQLVFVNGVLITDPDQPNPRKDKLYPFSKTGYELFDEGKFFYYSSLVKKMSKDEEIINILYRMVIDGTFLSLIPPMAIYGDEDVNSSVVTPGTITTMGETSRMEPINIGSNIAVGLQAIEKVEASLSESSNDVLQSGQDTPGSDTAFEISRLEQNAKIMLGLFAKMIGFMVKDFGILRVGDILQFLTVGDIAQIAGKDAPLKYQSFLIPDKTVNGKKKTRKIQFQNPEEFPKVQSPEDKLNASFDVMNQEGGINADTEIYKVNPELFRNIKFKVVVRPDAITPPSDALQKALNLEQYDRAIANPYADQKAIYQDLLLGSYEKTRDDVDKYTIDPQQMQQGNPAQALVQSGTQRSVLNKLFGNGQTGDLAKAAS